MTGEINRKEEWKTAAALACKAAKWIGVHAAAAGLCLGIAAFGAYVAGPTSHATIFGIGGVVVGGFSAMANYRRMKKNLNL